jgi:hypothetical protein
MSTDSIVKLPRTGLGQRLLWGISSRSTGPGVSTYGQTLDAQLEQLRGAGCTKIFREKVTGAHNDRRELLRMLDSLAPGDVVTVTRIDRLARSTFDLFAIVQADRGRQSAISLTCGTVGRHRNQHRAIDDRRARRPR